MNALLVKDEDLRNEALAQYEVLNTAPDPVLDDIARLAALLRGTLVALIVFVALVAVFDTAGRIVGFNRACEIASGYDFATLLGRYT